MNRYLQSSQKKLLGLITCICVFVILYIWYFFAIVKGTTIYAIECVGGGGSLKATSDVGGLVYRVVDHILYVDHPNGKKVIWRLIGPTMCYINSDTQVVAEPGTDV